MRPKSRVILRLLGRSFRSLGAIKLIMKGDFQNDKPNPNHNSIIIDSWKSFWTNVYTHNYRGGR